MVIRILYLSELATYGLYQCRALSTLEENVNMHYNAFMARKILIIIALIIAIFPFLGFSETADITVTTTLSALMAAMLLFSRRPRMQQTKQSQPLPKDVPSPFTPVMQEIPVAHREEEEVQPTFVHTEQPVVPQVQETTFVAIPPTVPLPMRKRARPLHEAKPLQQTENVQNAIPHVPEQPVRRQRRPVSRTILAQEDQVHPADIPVPAHVQANAHIQTPREV